MLNALYTYFVLLEVTSAVSCFTVQLHTRSGCGREINVTE